MSDGIPFAKGHGTENDFVVLPDPEGALDLTAGRVAALCDRRRGLGADGVLRVVRSEGGWFMDYRNADGSIAEMCGNGVRVFARYLQQAHGWPGGPVETRAGVKQVTFEGAGIAVEMGAARVFGESVAVVGGREFPGLAIDVGNPHLACVTSEDIAGLDLTVPPGRDTGLFPHGVNVEFVGSGDPVPLRVHERGVGETRSCGTGTVAAAVAALRAAGREDGRLAVDTPGGRLEVLVRAGGESTVLSGPAVLVAHGELDRGWWETTGQARDSVGGSMAR